MQSTQSQLRLKVWQGSKKNYDRLLTYKELEVGTIYFVGDNATFGTSKTGIIYIAVSKEKAVLFGAFDMAQLSQKIDEIERLLDEANGDIDRLIAEVSSNTEKLATIEEGAEKNKINAIERNGQAITPSEDKVINILIPIKTSELTNDSEYQTSADVAETIIGVDLNIASGIITLTRKNGTTFTIDLPTEKIIKSGYYDSETEEIVMVLADDSEIRFSASQLIDEYYADNVTLEQYTDTADGNKKKFRLTTSYKNKVDGAEQASNKTASVTSASTATQYPSALAVWNAIKNFATSVQIFTTASTRANIESGETISTIFGKIRKWLADLKAVAFSGSYSDLSDKPTIGNGTITIKQKGVEKGSFSMNQTGNATIELTDDNTTYGIATSTTSGLVKSGGNITVASDGAVTVNNASIANELKVNYFNGTFYGGSSSSGKTDGYLRICRFKRNSAQRESSMAIRIMWESWGAQKFGGVTVNFFQNSQGQNYFMGYLSEYTQMGSDTTRATSARFYYRTSGDYIEIYAYCTRGNAYGSWIFSTIQFDGGFDPPQSYYLQDVDVSSMALTELSVFQVARYDLEGNAISTTYIKNTSKTNLTSVHYLDWPNNRENVPTINTLAYWNGSYEVGGSSNIQKLGINLFLNGTKALRNAGDGWLRINDENTFANGTFFGTGLVRTDGNFRVGSNADTALDVTQSKFTWKGVNVATVNSTVAKADGLRGDQKHRNNNSRYVEMGRITVPTSAYYDKGFSVLIKGQHNTNIGDAYIFNVVLCTGASASTVYAKICCAMASRTNYNEVLVGELTSTHLILYFDCVLQNYTAWAWSILNDADGEFVPSSGNTYVASIPSSGGTKVAQENNMLAVKDGSGNIISNTYRKLKDVLEITDSNLATYYNSNTEVLSGISSTIGTILINCSSRIKISAIQMTDVFNGKRVSLIGEFVPSERYSSYNNTVNGGFSSFLYAHRPGSPNSSLNNDTVIRGYEDFIYFNGKWYGKGY